MIKYLFFLFSGLLMLSCGSSARWFTRYSHAFGTRYNIYYNAQSLYEKLFTASRDSVVSFDPVIEKCWKAVSLHTVEAIPPSRHTKTNIKKPEKPDQYNPYLHKVWLLMGKAQFQNKQYREAYTTFLYVKQAFSYNSQAVKEAVYWQNRCTMNFTKPLSLYH